MRLFHSHSNAFVQRPKTNRADPAAGPKRFDRNVLGADRFLLCAGLDLDLPGLAGLGNRYMNIEHAVVQPAPHVLDVKTARKSYRGVELAVRQLRVCVLLEPFRSLAFALDNQLVVLDAHVNVFLRDPREDSAQLQGMLGPAGFQHGAEVWNAWLDNHSDVIPDLRGADLSSRDLYGINLLHVRGDGTKFFK